MPPVGFEPTISAGERSQTYALDRVATGTGNTWTYTAYKQAGIGLIAPNTYLFHYLLLTPIFEEKLRPKTKANMYFLRWVRRWAPLVVKNDCAEDTV